MEFSLTAFDYILTHHFVGVFAHVCAYACECILYCEDICIVSLALHRKNEVY